MKSLLFLIPGLPLAGAAVCGLLGRRLGAVASRALACVTVLLSFILASGAFWALWGEPQGRGVFKQTLYTWIPRLDTVGGLHIEAALRWDPLSATMCLVVTGVGFLIHLYSVGYMARDESQPRYFAYLNLFTFAMLLLVMADNLLLMFVGWEGVGLCSYLLIGFWFSDLDKARAGMKAFVVNRIGDFGFFVGLMLLAATLGQAGPEAEVSLAYDDLRAGLEALTGAEPLAGVPLLTVVCVLLFVGACGKSAQIPLYVWLPDAMAGPTPVSALIHAATMVTAGVFMVTRLGFLYTAAPEALAVVAVVGGLTAFAAALMALGQNDIKKVLAYSTISQLGYMFLAAGVAAFQAAIFHLVTHAFFKALLFLGAGSVIHAVGHNDMRLMGGLRKHLPVTFLTFGAGYLTICGLPPLSGFFSKDEILLAAMTPGPPLDALGPALGWLGLVTAGLTALYMTRLFLLTFAGGFRGDDETGKHLHESPAVMTAPLAALALLSVAGGVIGLPPALHPPHLLGGFLAPVLPQAAAHHSVAAELSLMGLSTLAGLSGILIGWWLTMANPAAGREWARRHARLSWSVKNVFWVDEFYAAVVVRPFMALVRFAGGFDIKAIDEPIHLSSRFTVGASALVGEEDMKVVDGLVNRLAETVKAWGGAVRRIQTGRVQHYLYNVVVGLVFLYALSLLL